MRPHFAWLVPALLLHGAPALAEPGPHRVWVGHAEPSYSTFFTSFATRPWLELGWSYELPRERVKLPLELAAGLRGTTPFRSGLPLEGWARVRLVGRIGFWRPAVGPEIGLTGRPVLPATRVDGLPNDLDGFEQERLSPFFLSFEAAPLRFGFGRLIVSALELGLGTTLGPPGASLRTSLSWLRVEVAL